MRQQIASAIDVVIQVSRLSDGSRRLTNISEIVGMEGDVIAMQDLFEFQREGLTDDGKVKGRFRATGVRPKFSEKLEAHGIQLSETVLADSSQFRERLA